MRDRTVLPELPAETQQVLDALLSDFRDQVSSAARRRAELRTGKARSVSPLDVTEAFLAHTRGGHQDTASGRASRESYGAGADVPEASALLVRTRAVEERRTRSYERMTLLLRLYLALGGLFGVLGLLLAAVTLLPSSIPSATRQALLIAGAGFFVTVASFVGMEAMRAVIRIRLLSRRRAASAFDFLAAWMRLENEVRSAAATSLGRNTDTAPLSHLVYSLRRRHLMTRDEEIEFRRLTSLRNEIMHSGEPPSRDWALALEQADRMRTILHDTSKTAANAPDEPTQPRGDEPEGTQGPSA